MPSERRAYALLRALVAGLMAAGVMAAVVTIPSVGATATGPSGVTRALDPSDDQVDPDPDPEEDPPSPEPESPTPTESPTESESPSVPPPTNPETDPPTDPPSDPPTSEPTGVPVPTVVPPQRPGPVNPGQQPRLGALVWTSDITLGNGYWSRRATYTDLRVVVANTGSILERMTMRYTLPVGITDAGTPGCARSAGRTYVCGSWTVGPGLRFSTSIKVKVAGDAWRRMPLSGSVDVTADAPGRADLGTIGDNQGFAVLFPPGPPVPGINLAAGEVNFGRPDAPANLEIRLTNTGDAMSTGAVEVLLPAGVTVAQHPGGCAAKGDRTRCELGRLAPDQAITTTLPLRATIEAQRLAPLSGAAFGMLTAGGDTKRVQMSFRITADAATATPSATPSGAVGATASQGVIGGFAPVSGDQGLSGVQKTALALVVVSILLVILAITLATTSLRRGMEDDSTTRLEVPAAD
ncbi:hypothetical protein O7635_12280 [Asanoa sp. WMMD1127]|uniref:hypothetical protein n=1 Tax=Asanoa sp. WMMD1127 TaxID=3016107 RepID=UPI00241805B1|nr:hypothetical protein [Asanoa sp. WMMD1127]MDG4822629.1 hypothetical protein [Asanoa sp. WMMD1127]